MSEDENYVVSKIVDVKKENGVILFKVRWEGYTSEDDTWEPFEHVSNCQEALEEFRATQRRNKQKLAVPLLLPSDFDTIEDSPDENASGSATKFLPSTSEDEQSDVPCAKEKVKTSKKFRRISRIIVSSGSDSEALVDAKKGQQSVMQKKPEIPIKKIDKGKPLPAKISNVQKYGTAPKTATKNVVPLTKNPENSDRKDELMDCGSEMCKPQSKFVKKTEKVMKCVSDKPKVKSTSVQNPEKRKGTNLDSNLMNCPARMHKPEPKHMQKTVMVKECVFAKQKLKPKSAQPENLNSKELDSNLMDCDAKSLEHELKSAQKPEKLKRVEPGIAKKDHDSDIQKKKQKVVQKPDQLKRVEPSVSKKDHDSEILKTKQKLVQKPEKSKNVTSGLSTMHSNSETQKQKPSATKNGNANPETQKPISKIKNGNVNSCKPTTLTSTSHYNSDFSAAESSSEPTSFLKSFQIPRLASKPDEACSHKEPLLISDDNLALSRGSLSSKGIPKKSMKCVTKSASVVFPLDSILGITEQPQFPKKDISSKPDTKGMASATRTTATTKDPGSLSTGFNELSVNAQPPEFIADDSTTPQSSGENSLSHLVDRRPSNDTNESPMDDEVFEDPIPLPEDKSQPPLSPGCSPNSFFPINWSPRYDIDHCDLPFLNETSDNSRCTTISLPSVKASDDPESSNSENTKPLSTCSELNNETKVKTKPNCDVSNDVIESLHKWAKIGVWREIERWYRVPGRHDWEMTNTRGSTLLMQASLCKRTEVADLLLYLGANANAQQLRNKKTPLMIASENGNEEVIKTLIAFGAKLNMVDNSGKTALMWAASKGHEKVVELLLNNGADFFLSDNKGRTAVDVAKSATMPTSLNVENMISNLESRVTSAFKEQIQLVLDKQGNILQPLFKTTIFCLNEGRQFDLYFDYKMQPQTPDTGMLLFSAFAEIDVNEPVRCRLYGSYHPVKETHLNGVRQISLTNGGDFVLSFCPLMHGKNHVRFSTDDMECSDIRLIVRAYKVQLQK